MPELPDIVVYLEALEQHTLGRRLVRVDVATPDEISRLFDTARGELSRWIVALREVYGSTFPEGVTAFRSWMGVRGKFQKPCPRCGARVQRIRYAANETDHCPACQTEGRLLADRALSRLLRDDWPRTVENLEDPKKQTGM